VPGDTGPNTPCTGRLMCGILWVPRPGVRRDLWTTTPCCFFGAA